MSDQRPTEEAEERLALGSSRLGMFILRWRLAIIVAAFAVTALAAAGIPFLAFNPDTRSFFGTENPERIALESMEKKYAVSSNLVMIMTPKGGDVFTPDFLALLGEVTREAWKTPYTLRVDSLANYQELKADGDDLKVEQLYSTRKKLTAEEAASVRARVLANRELVGQAISAKGDVTSVVIYVNRPRKSRTEVREMATFARELAAETMRKNPDVEVRLTGGVIGDLAFVEAGQRDVMALVPLMAFIIVAVLVVGLRSWAVTIVTTTVIALTVIITMGVYGWFGVVLNTMTAAAPPVIMTLFFADCVHFVMTAMQQRSRGRTREEAIAETVRLQLLPTLIKTGTTAIGFLSLNFSDSPPLNQFGNIVAVGSLIGCVLTVTLIPALLSYMRLPEFAEGGWAKTSLQRMAVWIMARNRAFLYGFVALFLAMLWFIPTISLNDNFVRYFDTSFEFRVNSDYLEERLTGLHGIIYSVPAGKAEGITDPAYLRRLDAFAEWYRKQPHVAHVSTLADIIRRLNKAMNNDDPAFDTIPDNKQLIAQYLMLYELSLPQGRDLSGIIDVGRAESMVTVRLNHVTSKTIIALSNEGQVWLKQNAPEQQATATGLSVVYSYLSRRNIDAMMAGTAISVVLVSLLMGITLKSYLHGIISLVVNLAPAGIAFGLWGLLGLEVNLAISVVTSITYGIVTDDTVHTMTKYRWAREMEGLAPAAAAQEVLTYTGGAVILSSVALALGFALLGFSTFNITATVGLLAALIIALAALAELLVLPGLLIMFDRKQS